MKNLKKIFLVIVYLFFFTLECSSAIKDSIFATVGNRAITESDIVNEIKIMLISSGKIYSEDIKDQLQAAAINSTVRRNIKMIAIEQHTLNYNQDDLYSELNKMATKLNMDLDQFKKIFINNGIDFSKVIEIVEVELLWNSLIFKLYKDRLLINAEEIEEQLKSIQNKKDTYEDLISEIIIRSVPANEIKSKIKEIKNKIKNEGFEQVAMNLSISETSIKGGDLGWLSENVISEKIKSKIINTKTGELSEPILLPEGILIFLVKNKRKLDNMINLEDAKNQLVKAEKNKILTMHSLSHYDTLKRSVSINYY